ncbi:hypothetical protein EST38_g11415 [Candolleomyces aberdarensis]|uniref:Uncharacterized protein n=1 Tax=Candolleomyces aberdarensis TaxID=2316362 RepID=A0A4Q2D5K5_9AGAR|nr:hypothetical protein EST38_g11415 [Candolleomyces aberdarensis]
MNAHYDINQAKAVLQGLYNRDPAKEGVAKISSITEDNTKICRIKYPPSIRLMKKEGNNDVEVIVKMYGVSCGLNLPPLKQKPKNNKLGHIRSLRQHVKLTAFDLEAFKDDLRRLRDLHARMDDSIGGKRIHPMDYLPYEGYEAVDSHARYFTDRSQAPYESDTPFSRLVDPYNILSDIKPDFFIHGADNWVEYCKETTEGQHAAIDPSTFKNGDVVEIAFACVGVPAKEGQHRLLLNLKAVTLINDDLRKEAERKKKEARTVQQGTEYIGLKRRTLYVDMDAPIHDEVSIGTSREATSKRKPPAVASKMYESSSFHGIANLLNTAAPGWGESVGGETGDAKTQTATGEERDEGMQED